MALSCGRKLLAYHLIGCTCAKAVFLHACAMGKRSCTVIFIGVLLPPHPSKQASSPVFAVALVRRCWCLVIILPLWRHGREWFEVWWSIGEREPWLLRPCLPQYVCQERFPLWWEGEITCYVMEYNRCQRTGMSLYLFLCVREWVSVVPLALCRRACLIITLNRKDSSFGVFPLMNFVHDRAWSCLNHFTLAAVVCMYAIII